MAHPFALVSREGDIWEYNWICGAINEGISMQLAKRLEDIAESITLAVTAKANALKKAGVDVVSYGAGEPDFDTPAFIKEAAIKALLAGKTKYEPTPGTMEARKA